MADLFTVVFPFVQSLGFFFQTLSKKPQKNISHHMIVTNYYWTQFSIQKRQNAIQSNQIHSMSCQNNFLFLISSVISHI